MPNGLPLDGRQVQYRLATALTFALVAGAVVVTPFVDIPLTPVPGFLTACGASLIIINLLLASLLFSRGSVGRHNASIRLGAAYFFVASVQVPWLAAFPGAFVAGPLFGTQVTSVWLWCFTHFGFLFGVIRYAILSDGTSASVTRSVIFGVAASVVLTLTATQGLPYLPSMLSPDGHLFIGFCFYVPPAMLLILGMVLVMVLRGVTGSTARLWLAVGLVAEAFDIWLLYCGTIRYSLGWYVANCGGLLMSLVVLISALHDITVMYHQMAQANERLIPLANIDGLTGLANRRRLDEAAQMEWPRAQRAQQPISAIMIDVDFFKRFNDHYGHLQGDDCLRQVAAVMRSVGRRPSDLAARYGGEEFVLLLPATDIFGAIDVARLLHGRLQALAIPHAASPFGIVTVSAGIGTLYPGPHCSLDTLIGLADSNLYLAKQAGRNMTRADAQMPQSAIMG